jgi:hypothetical protein
MLAAALALAGCGAPDAATPASTPTGPHPPATPGRSAESPAADSTPGRTESEPPTAMSSPVTTTAGSAAGRARFALGTTVRAFTDTGRQRTLETIIHYPAAGRPGTNSAIPADGAFPLVLLAHGYRLPADGYERIVTALATAGYITAAPWFPHTSPRGDANRSDIVNQPADLSFVADAVVAMAGRPTDDGPGIPAVADPDHLAVVGHSDGGLTASAIAYNERYRDPRVVAAVVMTGGRALFPGSYHTGADLPALLAVHGTADGNPYSGSLALVRDTAASGRPAWLLTVEDGAHIEPYMYDTAMPEIATVVVDFIDGTLGGDPSRLAQLATDGSVPGRLRIEGG